jgi:hypothetical protein
VVHDLSLSINQETSRESQQALRDFLFQQTKEVQDNSFLDRTVIDNYIYTLVAHEKGAIKDDFVRETWDRVIESLQYIDVFIFIPTSVSVSLKDDTLRDCDPAYIDKVNRAFIEVLMKLVRDNNITVWTIAGNPQERVENVKKKLEEFSQ